MYAMIFEECVLQYRVARSYAYVCVCWSQHIVNVNERNKIYTINITNHIL